MTYRLLYFILLATLLPFTACDSVIYDQPGGNEEKVYLSVSTRAAQANSGLRSSDTESINMDGTDFEDAVHNLAMLVFDSSDTGKKISEYFSPTVGSGKPATRVFNIEITPGQYDFYFVANMPQEDLQGTKIPDRNAMNAYLEDTARILNDGLYLGASSTGGFPMARVYLNQVITKGGTIYQPMPFKPKQGNTEGEKVVVNVADNGADEREYVELIRVVAKLEVTLEGSNLSIAEVKFHNAFREYSLAQLLPPAEPKYYNDAPLKKINDSTYVYYMPEALMSTDVAWTDAADHKPINYFSIKTLAGQTYEIPIITNSTGIPTEGYLPFAEGKVNNNKPDYNIYRNHHYKYVVKNLEKIEIFYEVDPWNVVNKSTYMGYGYNVEVDDEGNITVTNTIDDCLPHKVEFKALNGAYFSTPSETTKTFGYTSKGDVDFDSAKLKTGYFENYVISKDGVSSGNVYLQVYYNDNLVKTFTK